MADWTGLRTWLLGEVEYPEADINIPDEQEMERLVALHGWEAFGAVVQAVTDEKKLQMMVRCGVPFTEAAKIIGLREEDRDELH